MMGLFTKNISLNNLIKYILVLLIILIGCDNNYNELGCIYPEACNYDPNASEDDGSCEYESCSACLDPEACNYDLVFLMSLDTIIDNPNLCIYPEENYDCYGNSIDFRSQYIGEWEFIRTSGSSSPYGSNSSDTTWIGFISYGNSYNTINIPYGPYNNSTYVFEVNELGELDDEDTPGSPFNYYFNGYFTGDSILYYTGTGGSPFSTSTITINAEKIQ